MLKKLKVFTKEKYDFRIAWKTKKIKQLFTLKEKNPDPSCKIYEGVYEGVCSCKENYISETKRNVIIRWYEHENPKKDSEPAKYPFQHPNYVFQGKF